MDIERSRQSVKLPQYWLIERKQLEAGLRETINKRLVIEPYTTLYHHANEFSKHDNRQDHSPPSPERFINELKGQ